MGPPRSQNAADGDRTKSMPPPYPQHYRNALSEAPKPFLKAAAQRRRTQVAPRPTKNHGVRLQVYRATRCRSGLADTIGGESRPRRAARKGPALTAASGRLKRPCDGQAPKTMGETHPGSIHRLEGVRKYSSTGLHKYEFLYHRKPVFTAIPIKVSWGASGARRGSDRRRQSRNRISSRPT